MDREALTKDRSVARCIAEGYRLFTGQQLTTLRRTWKPLVASSLGWALSITTALCGQWIGTALALLLALAALVVFKRTILQLVAPMPKCGRATKRVLRHLGSYLTYALLSGIIGLVVFTLLMIPAIILLIEGYFDYTLAAEGDPRVLGMGYWVLTTATLTFCLALVFYAMIWKTFGEAYLYGAMVAQDEVRKRQQARTTTWTTAAD